MTNQPFCIVAGVGPGIGLAVARRFGREGHAVGLIARRADALEGYARDLRAEGIEIEWVAADLSDLAAAERAYATLLQRRGPAGVLVHNAAVWRQETALSTSPGVFHADLALSVTSALVGIQAVHPGMAAAGGGAILLTGGALALAPQYGTVVPSLTAGKSALRGLTYALAGELSATGVHVAMVTIAGTVAPGGPFDPDLIAGEFLALRRQPRDGWEVERIIGAEGVEGRRL